MANITTSTSLKARDESTSRTFISGPSFDAVFIISALWYQTGGWLDSWAHRHIKLETFLTPWHAVLYSGLFVTTMLLISTIIINRIRGASWQEAIPVGYALGLYGVIGFFIGGVGDMIWHTLFGNENNVDAQYSPTHLMLFIFGFLFTTSPLRSLYARPSQKGIFNKFLVLGASFQLFMAIEQLMQTIHPYVDFWPLKYGVADILGQRLGMASIFLQTVIMMCFYFYLIRRWQLFPGFFTIMITINYIPLGFMADHPVPTIVMGFLVGLFTDIAYAVLRPSFHRVMELRLFSFVVPAIWMLVYMLTLSLIDRSHFVWSIHLAGGAVVLAGVLGVLLSCVVVPTMEPSNIQQ